MDHVVSGRSVEESELGEEEKRTAKSRYEHGKEKRMASMRERGLPLSVRWLAPIKLDAI